MIILGIDTSVSERITIFLDIDGKRHKYTKESQDHTSQMLLPLIESSIKEHGISLEDITKISFFVGPGSYTGLRVGAAIANTLSYILRIPINENPVGTIIEPIYE
ncbi:MAG: tRNA (adenosine(37)-N6)-threonylcarbamoyltransferase complex dimerization subunit type 1 TsaB [Candidatus Levybacteria bacterium]|nr:tRNA (adenosine(37)-N6)-threonylcarbamoyltransferase complex dimerization subunit type 1 TsaB [Candidatus Levybacteria bacterium]